jgi:CubicO group peptidase (beta-lactamase class C family)
MSSRQPIADHHAVRGARIRRGFLSALLLVSLSTCVGSDAAAAATAEVTAKPRPAHPLDVATIDRILDVLEQNGRLMGSITFMENGKVIYTRALGFRDRTSKGIVKSDPNTMYRIGSITKVFTAALIYQLIDEHKLSLDTKLSDYFPRIANADRITIRHLLAHTSGIPTYPSAADYRDPKGWSHQAQTKAQMLERFATFKSDFTPGEKVAYSNANYALLGYIVEAVTGSTYATQLDRRIVRKLGLKRTRFGGAVNSANDEAHSYTYDDNVWTEQPEEDLTISAGAGAIVSTTRDLDTFITALFSGKLISRKSMEEMTSPFSPALTGGERKGVVAFTMRGVDKLTYTHLGGIDAFSANLIYVPEDRFALAIDFNGQNYPMSKIFWSLVDTYYGRPTTIPSFEPKKLPAETLTRYEGVYEFKAAGMSITVKRSGDQLTAQATNQEAFPITAISETLFSDKSSGILIEFKSEAGGAVPYMTLFQGRNESRWTR